MLQNYNLRDHRKGGYRVCSLKTGMMIADGSTIEGHRYFTGSEKVVEIDIQRTVEAVNLSCKSRLGHN